MTDSIELVVRELISKVEASQSLIDELRSKLQSQNEVEAELEYYYLLCQKQLELLAANEDLQKQVIDILVNLER